MAGAAGAAAVEAEAEKLEKDLLSPLLPPLPQPRERACCFLRFRRLQSFPIRGGKLAGRPRPLRKKKGFVFEFFVVRFFFTSQNFFFLSPLSLPLALSSLSLSLYKTTHPLRRELLQHQVQRRQHALHRAGDQQHPVLRPGEILTRPRQLHPRAARGLQRLDRSPAAADDGPRGRVGDEQLGDDPSRREVGRRVLLLVILVLILLLLLLLLSLKLLHLLLLLLLLSLKLLHLLLLLLLLLHLELHYLVLLQERGLLKREKKEKGGGSGLRELVYWLVRRRASIGMATCTFFGCFFFSGPAAAANWDTFRALSLPSLPPGAHLLTARWRL